MRKIVRNLLILIAVCIGIIYFSSRFSEGFAWYVNSKDYQQYCGNTNNPTYLPWFDTKDTAKSKYECQRKERGIKIEDSSIKMKDLQTAKQRMNAQLNNKTLRCATNYIPTGYTKCSWAEEQKKNTSKVEYACLGCTRA